MQTITLARTIPVLIAALWTAPRIGAQEPERFPDFPDQDALRYSLDMRVDLAKQRLTGRVTYRIKALAPLQSVRFHAKNSAEWSVAFIDADGKALPAQWESEKDTVRVPLGAPVKKGDTLVLHAELAGTPVDGFHFKKNRYGEVLAFTDHYSIRARGWLPCEDHPADRARWDLRLTYPQGNEAVAYGKNEIGVDASDGTRVVLRATSDVEVPPYMFALVVGPFARVEEPSHDKRVTPHLVYAKDLAEAKKVLVHHGQWIAIMEAAIGKYPYEKYTTVQCPTRWGGFEAPGNVQLSERLFDRGGVGTLAHELVHMWFGDGVGYARWREVWLSEGFASYFGPWLHANVGGPKLEESLQGMRDRWRKSFESRTKTVRDDTFPHPDQALNSNTYPKGAWILHMLRGELGDQRFFNAIKTYYGRCVGRSVTTKEFVAIIEEVAEQQLSWFFDQWLDRVDCPHLSVRAANDEIVVEQVHKGAPYRFWLRLGYRGPDGKPMKKRIRIEKATTSIKTDGTITDLVTDPDTELLFR